MFLFKKFPISSRVLWTELVQYGLKCISGAVDRFVFIAENYLLASSRRLDQFPERSKLLQFVARNRKGKIPKNCLHNGQSLYKARSSQAKKNQRIWLKPGVL